jgi:hypothetical protein
MSTALPETAGAPDREAEREGGAGREQDHCKRGRIGLDTAGDEHGRDADQADETAPLPGKVREQFPRWRGSY